MTRAFITGATGFVGSNLVAYLLKQGWEVTGFVRDANRTTQLTELGAKLHLGNLADSDSLIRGMQNVDVVFHVAGRTRALSAKEFATDNVDGTHNVVEAAAAQSKPPVVVLVSSLAAGGPSRPGIPRREINPDQPVSDYGRSKLAAEQAARKFADEVPISIIRPPIIFGPGDTASLAVFSTMKRWRIHLNPGFRQFPVSIVHVADLCDAMLGIAERGRRIGVGGSPKNDVGLYHVAAERTITYGELGKLAAQSIDRRGFVVPLPKAIFWTVGGMIEVLGQLRRHAGVITLDKIREAVAPGWEGDDEKIRKELGYRPAASLEERFAETAAWYLEQGWL